jgi:hypothetical protein
MTEVDPGLYQENMVILMGLQAIWGALSSNLKALSLEFQNKGVIAHFLLREHSAEDELEITENFADEVSAFTIGVPGIKEPRVKPVIEIVKDYPADYVPPGRSVLLFRD